MSKFVARILTWFAPMPDLNLLRYIIVIYRRAGTQWPEFSTVDYLQIHGLFKPVD